MFNNNTSVSFHAGAAFKRLMQEYKRKWVRSRAAN